MDLLFWFLFKDQLRSHPSSLTAWLRAKHFSSPSLSFPTCKRLPWQRGVRTGDHMHGVQQSAWHRGVSSTGWLLFSFLYIWFSLFSNEYITVWNINFNSEIKEVKIHYMEKNSVSISGKSRLWNFKESIISMFKNDYLHMNIYLVINIMLLWLWVARSRRKRSDICR